MSSTSTTTVLSVREPSARWLSMAPPLHVLVDSGPLLALFNRSDTWHAPCMGWLQAHPQARLHSTWPVLTEVCALLARRVHNQAALDCLRWIEKGGVLLDPPPDTSLASVLDICQRFADRPLDLADASIAEASARLYIRPILSIDKDFDIYRDAQGQPLVNLLR